MRPVLFPALLLSVPGAGTARRSRGGGQPLLFRLCGEDTGRDQRTNARDKVLPRYKPWSEDTRHVKGDYTEMPKRPKAGCFRDCMRGVILNCVCHRCRSLREEKRRKDEEEKEARKRAEEEEEARRRAEEEEEERRRVEEEEMRRKAEEEEEEARRRKEEEEAARVVLETELRQEREPQTREDPDIELVTEETLNDNLPVQETAEERGGEVITSPHAEEEQAKDEEPEDEELDLVINGTPAEAGPQLDEKEEEDEDLENQTLGESDSKPDLPSDEVGALTPTSPGEGLDKKPLGDTSASVARGPALNKGPLSRSQEKRAQRRQRGLEHNQRATERASSSSAGKDERSPAKNKSQEASGSKERADSKQLDQYTFVAWKMTEDKGGKKETKSPPPPARPVRPTTLSLQPAEPVPERNGTGEGAGAVNLHRRPGAIKEKHEKWRGRRSDGEHSEGANPPQPHSREERRRKQPLYVFSSDDGSDSHKSILCLTSVFLSVPSVEVKRPPPQWTVCLQVQKAPVLFQPERYFSFEFVGEENRRPVARFLAQLFCTSSPELLFCSADDFPLRQPH